MNSKHRVLIVRFALGFGIHVLFAACSEDPPAQPPMPPPPDTTSHDWYFTKYHVTGYSLRDVAALAPDYVVMVGEGVHGTNVGTNAYLWNGSELKEMSIPLKPGGTPDTCTTCTPGVNIGLVRSMVSGYFGGIITGCVIQALSDM